MKIKHLSYFILFLFSSFCYSQTYNVKGVLQDGNNQPIGFANAVLIDLDDTSIIKGTITDDFGKFTLDKIKPGDYIFKISFLGFESYSSRINLDRDFDLEIITLKEATEELDGVTVVAKRPTIKRLVDRVIFNVENSTLSNNNVLDVLKHTPGVLINNGNISLKNSTPTTYINDRKVHLSIEEVQQLLESTPANNIKSIEVITNPPAKYEAEGGAVLNIVTSKNIIVGYHGSFFENYKQGREYPKYSFGTGHFLKTKKLSTYLNYNISPKKEFRHNDEFINFINNNKIISNWNSRASRINESSNQNINGTIDYEINNRNNLGFTTNLLVSPRKSTKKNIHSITEIFDAIGNIDSTFNTVNKAVDEINNFSFTLDYIHKFKNEGEKLYISAHNTNYDFSNFQNVDTDYFLPNESLIRSNKFKTFTSQKINIYTGQLDYELPFNDSALFEIGIKFSNINSQSILNQFIYDNDVKEDDLENSDTFLYDESNFASYASYANDWEDWSLKTGLRIEHTNISGNSISTSQINNSYYSNFFPSVHLSRNFNENNELYFNYNKHINRPRYRQLNPFKFFLNDNTYLTGDPKLKPQIDNSFIIGYNLKQKYTFEIYYRHEDDPTIQIAFQDNDNNILKYINTNIDKSISYGLDFSTYTNLLKKWDLYVLSSIYFYEEQFFALESNNELLTNSKWSSYSQVINYFSFLKDSSFTTNLSFTYISAYILGPTNISTTCTLDIELKKILWNNRASFSVGITDILNRKNFNTRTKYANQDIMFNSQLENRMFTFGFNYKFGNYRLNRRKKEINLSERDRIKSD